MRPTLGARPSRRVIWAEDALDDQFLIRQSINQMRGAPEVTFTGDGAQFLEAVQRRMPDLAVLDVNMPVLDGLSSLRRLRADPRTRHLPAIVFSTARDERDVQVAQELGVADFVQKPSSFDDFARAVARILAHAQPAGHGDAALLPAAGRAWGPVGRGRPSLRE